MTERDEPYVEPHVLKQRIVEQTRVVQLKLRTPVDDAFPFEVERGIQVHVVLNEILNHFVKDRRFHPLIQEAVLMPGLNSHSFQRLSSIGLTDCGNADACHVLHAVDTPCR